MDREKSGFAVQRHHVSVILLVAHRFPTRITELHEWLIQCFEARKLIQAHRVIFRLLLPAAS